MQKDKEIKKKYESVERVYEIQDFAKYPSQKM